MRHARQLITLATTLALVCFAQLSLAQGNSQNAGNGNSNAGGNGNGNAFGRSKNIGVGNASDGIKGRIITGKDIAYTGDPLEISLQFPRGAELVSEGTVDAYVIIFSPLVGDDDDSDDDDDTSDDSDSGSDDDSSTDDDESSTESDDSSGSDSDDDSDDADDSDGDSEDSSDALSDAIVLPVSGEASAEARRLFAIDAVDLSVLPAGTYQLGLVLTNPGGDPLDIDDWYAGLLGLIDVVGLTVTGEAVPFDADGDGEVDDDTDGDGFSDDDESEGDDDDDDSEDDDDDSDSSAANTTT